MINEVGFAPRCTFAFAKGKLPFAFCNVKKELGLKSIFSLCYLFTARFGLKPDKIIPFENKHALLTFLHHDTALFLYK